MFTKWSYLIVPKTQRKGVVPLLIKRIRVLDKQELTLSGLAFHLTLKTPRNLASSVLQSIPKMSDTFL
jgi:hypothetical protein